MSLRTTGWASTKSQHTQHGPRETDKQGAYMTQAAKKNMPSWDMRMRLAAADSQNKKENFQAARIDVPAIIIVNAGDSHLLQVARMLHSQCPEKILGVYEYVTADTGKTLEQVCREISNIDTRKVQLFLMPSEDVIILV